MNRQRCRSCDSKNLRVIFDFGFQPLAGEFPLVPESKKPVRRYPLDFTQCDTCGLLQVTNLPPIDAVFNDNYRYSSSTVPALVQHFNDYADWIEERLPIGASILEFGCNDGVLLEILRNKGYDCLGIDASDNVAELARAKNIRVHTGFMTVDLIEKLGLVGKHHFVTCSNVLAHIDDVHSALAAVWHTLRPEGLFTIEVHDADALVRDSQFETIYHEHLSYFTELTLRRLVESEGFTFVDCIRTPMHGGGLRLTCKKEGNIADLAPDYDCKEMVPESFFSEVINRCSSEIRAMAHEYGPLDGFGAAGRSQMFINMTKTEDCFAQVFDDSPFRQDRYIVGTDIPIRSFNGQTGRACVILAWNYAPSIAKRITGEYEEVITVLPKKKRW